MSSRFLRCLGAPLAPAASRSASIVTSFKLLPAARARSRHAASSDAGIPRIVYCMHLL
jgi:hypothetical protein